MHKTITYATLAGLLMLASPCATPAQADPIVALNRGLGVGNLEFQAPHYFKGFVGQFIVDKGLTGTTDDFIAYCVDATMAWTDIQFMTIRPVSQLPDRGNPPNVLPGAGARIAWLLNTYGSNTWLATDGNNRAAALQIAIWEVLYDSFGSYDIRTGTFKLLYSGNHPELLSYTNAYFRGLGANTSEAIWLDITNPVVANGQDYAAPMPSVPEPGTLVLVGSGLFGLVRGIRRRRR